MATTAMRHSFLLTLVLSVMFGLSGCGDDDSRRPDTGADGGGDPGTGNGNGADGDADSETPGFALRFHDADGQYEGWQVELSGDVQSAGRTAASGDDEFGAVFEVPLTDGAESITYRFVDDAGNVEPNDPVALNLEQAPDGVWHFAGRDTPLLRAPAGIPGPEQVVVYYLREDGVYDEWGLHIWGDVANETEWAEPLPQAGIDPELGAYWLVDVVGDQVNFIVHIGDLKDPGPDMGFSIAELGDIVFMRSGSPEIFSFPVEFTTFDGARAHWVSEDTVAWSVEAAQVELRASASGDVSLDANAAGDTETVTLEQGEASLEGELAGRYPHLQNRQLWQLPSSALAQVASLLQSELVAVAKNASGQVIDATRVQTAGVIDALYTYDGPLGVTFNGDVPEIRLWAPTAQVVSLVHLDGEDNAETLPMTRGADGVWSFTGADASWMGTRYRYQVVVFHPETAALETVEVTDPYSVALTANSTFSRIVDLDDPATKPGGWDGLTKPGLDAPEDITIYELHLRDFSVWDESVPMEDRGKYAAFVGDGSAPSDGRQHLIDLQAAGLSHLHLLPSFDIATVSEDPSEVLSLDDGFDALCAAVSAVPAERCDAFGSTAIRDVLEGFDPTSGDAQEVMGYLRNVDGFNWGYDPFHYNVPEGSYAKDPDGATRVFEFREMVQSLNELGLRVVMDVVYNHTNASGVGPTSVLDKIVPGYYQRLNTETGAVENSTCCANTASENAMMERLMIDSVLLWATQYKIDAFRFDLMGHHMKSNMEMLRARLDELTVEADGVDGRAVFVYGEGWDFGEVQGGQRGVNATQANMAGTGIGTFSDRLRDAVRGGGPFDSGEGLRANQGFINGLSYDPNEIAPDPDASRADSLLAADRIRVGMAGNLKSFLLVDRAGENTRGDGVDYNGSPTGYTEDPQEVITYVSKHDNQTLFDINAYKTPTGTSMDDRVRIQNLGVSITALGQGIPFFHAGVELLRSKSMQRDSFDSGDWFNALDFSYQSTRWNVGLPRADKDMDNWPTIQTVIADSSIDPQPVHIAAAREHFLEMLEVRASTPLLRLRTADDVNTRVHYHNTGPDQVPGLIVQTVSDSTCAGEDLDPTVEGLVGIINASDEAQSFVLSGANGYVLHPTLAASADSVVQGASFDDGSDTFTVPARTTAVFWIPQSGAQGSGTPCNPL